MGLPEFRGSVTEKDCGVSIRAWSVGIEILTREPRGMGLVVVKLRVRMNGELTVTALL